MITVAAANPAVDKLLHVDKLDQGSIHRPYANVAVPGGKGLNVARVAKSLGADVQVVGIAAGTSGEWLGRQLDRLGIPATWVWTDGETRTCTSIADSEAEGRLTEFYEPGPHIPAEVWRRFSETVAAQADQGEWLAVSGSLPPGAPDDGFGSLLSAHPRYTAVDTSGNALRAASRVAVDLVKLNMAEASDLVGLSADTGPSVASLARALRAKVGQQATVVVTAGEKGAVMLTAEGEMLHAGTPARGRYPVGSGDAFLAGMLTARQAGKPWQEALRLATAAAVANSEMPGAGLLDANRVRTLLPVVPLRDLRETL